LAGKADVTVKLIGDREVELLGREDHGRSLFPLPHWFMVITSLGILKALLGRPLVLALPRQNDVSIYFMEFCSPPEDSGSLQSCLQAACQHSEN
jgi:hypothetical protein